MKRNITWIGLLLVVTLGSAGCEMRPSLVRAPAADVRATLMLKPTLSGPQGLQAIVPETQASEIHRVEIVPYLYTETHELRPLSKVSGEPTDADAPEILKVEMSGAALELRRAIALSGLRPHRSYRIVANAYTLAGELISDPDSSGIWVEVEADDRPQLPTVLPLRLKAAPFYGRLPLDLQLMDPGEKVHHVEVSVFRVWNDLPYVQGVPVSLPRADIPHVVTVSNLEAYASYQIKLKARPADANGPDLAVDVLEIHMENDDAPATRSVTLTVP
ncbi:hypothetical protein D3C86_598580 [compost metagenome]